MKPLLIRAIAASNTHINFNEDIIMTTISRSTNSTRFFPALVAGLLVLSSGLLTSLVPGGPIETRSFAHIHPVILASFNTFLTTLSLTSPLLAYFVWKRHRWAFVAAALYGFSYFWVYALDGLHWFPVSPDSMPTALWVIELVGAIVSLPLMGLALRELALNDGFFFSTTQMPTNSSRLVQPKVWAMLLGLLVIGLGIIVFATVSAMG